jgi:phage minor structural protein
VRKIDELSFAKPTIYVQDQNEMVLGSTGNYYDSNLKWVKETDLAVLTYSIPANDSAAAYMTKLNLLTFVLNGRPWRFQISQAVYDTNGKAFQITAKAFSITLNQSLVDAAVAPSQQEPASFYIGQTLKGLDWTIGRDELGSTTLHTVAFSDQSTVLARLYSIADAFNCALDFRIELDGLKVKSQYIDILHRLGSDRNDIQLVYGDNVTNISKTVDCSTIATALEITGLPKDDDKGNSIDDAFFDLAYTSDDGRFVKPKDSYVMYDQTTNKRLNQGAAYILGTFDGSSIQNVQAAFTALTEQLTTQSQPVTTIDTSLAYVPNTLTIGDTVRLISNDPDDSNYLKTDVQELDICLDNPSKSGAVFGDYQPLVDGDNLYDLTKIKQSIAAAQSLAATAQNTANTANTNAATAQATANTANATANTANTTANQAKTMLPIISTTAPANPQEGQIWFEGADANDIKAIHKYVYGSWQTNALLPTSLNVQQLSALSADLGTVTAGTLQAVNIISSSMHNAATSDDPNRPGKQITNTQDITKDGYRMVTDRYASGTDELRMLSEIDKNSVIKLGYGLKKNIDLNNNPWGGVIASMILDPVNQNIMFHGAGLGDYYLNIQDAYHNDMAPSSFTYFNGYGPSSDNATDPNNGHLFRFGRTVVLNAYFKRKSGSNNGAYTDFFQLPVWARPAQTAFVYLVLAQGFSTYAGQGYVYNTGKVHSGAIGGGVGSNGGEYQVFGVWQGVDITS